MKILKSTLVIAALAAMPVALAYNPQAKKSTASKTSTKKTPAAPKKQAQRKSEQQAAREEEAPQKTFQSLMADIRKEKDHKKIIQNGVFTESFKQSVFNADLDDVLTRTLFEAGRNLHAQWSNDQTDDLSTLGMTDGMIGIIMSNTPAPSPLLGYEEKVNMPGLPLVPGEEEPMPEFTAKKEFKRPEQEFTAKREFKRGATTPAPAINSLKPEVEAYLKDRLSAIKTEREILKRDTIWQIVDDASGKFSLSNIDLHRQIEPLVNQRINEIKSEFSGEKFDSDSKLFTDEYLQFVITKKMIDGIRKPSSWNRQNRDQKIGSLIALVYAKIPTDDIKEWAQQPSVSLDRSTSGQYAAISEQIRQYLKDNATALGL